ncbi:TPA: hypothetical protein ACQRN9_003596 [Pseudomonas aeruginosa]
MSQNTQQDSRPIVEVVDLPEFSAEPSTEFLTGSAPCAGVSRPLPAAWLGQRGIYRSRFEAVCNGEQLVDPLTLGELIQRAWPSPSTELAERGTQHRFSTTEQTCRHDFYGVWWNDSGVTKTGRECRHCGFFVADMTEAAAEQAEAERPEVVAYADPVAFATFKERGHEGGVAGREWMWAEPGAALVAMSRTDECERIVGALRAKADQLREALEWRKENQAGQRELLRSVTAERDAALARVAELETALEPFAAVADAYDDSEDDDHEPYTDMGCDDRLRLTLGQHRAGRIALEGRTPQAQAQHSVPEEFIGRLSEFLAQRGATGKALLRALRTMLAAAPGKEVPQAWLDVQAERRRQVEAEGWTPEHDDEHADGQMAQAAGCYALHAGGIGTDWPDGRQNGAALFWPWYKDSWKPTTPRRDLVKACALALAEIERLDRAAATQGGPSDA